MRVIYGGTFDPVHIGHLRLAVELQDALSAERVDLVPCHVPPHRDVPGASALQRLELLALAIEGEPGLAVDDRELKREGASYTADTLRQIRQEIGPDEPLVMAVGTDAFAKFDQWREWNLIPELAHIVVIVRPGADIPEGSAAHGLIAERGVGAPEALHREPCGHVLCLQPPELDISATAIREKIASGQSPRYLMPESVWQYIRRSGLYGA